MKTEEIESCITSEALDILDKFGWEMDDIFYEIAETFAKNRQSDTIEVQDVKSAVEFIKNRIRWRI